MRPVLAFDVNEMLLDLGALASVGLTDSSWITANDALLGVPEHALEADGARDLW